MIRPGWLPFDFQPNRVLLLFLLLLLSLNYLGVVGPSAKFRNRLHKPDFIKYLVLYIVFVCIAMLINRNVLTIKRIIAVPLEPFTFLLLYEASRIFITEKLLKKILYAILIMASFNAVIAFYQVAIDPYFLRTGTPRIAFGGIYRAYGVFPTEYVLGGFQLISLFTAFVFIKRKMLRYLLISLISASIFVTFHRLDLLILVVGVLIYLSKYSKKKTSVPVLAALFLVAVAIIPSYMVMKSITGGSQFVSERLGDDTVTGRFQQFALVIKAMPGHPLGVGSYDNPAYQKLMISHGMTKSILRPDGRQEAVALGVHNGFLGAGIQYGIAAMIVFFILLWKMFRYFYKRASRSNPLTVIPLFSVAIWILSNISNGIIVFSSYNILVVALLCGAFVGMYEKGLINREET